MKKYVLIMTMMAGALCMAMPALAESQEARAERPHEVRIGIGDSFADSEFNGPSYYNYGGSAPSYRNEFYTPNLFAEYQYRINHWLGIGVQVNTMWMGWQKQSGNQWNTSKTGHFEIMPTVRFTYFHHEWVNLYSSVALGYYGGIEQEGESVNYAGGIAFDFCALGVSVGRNRFFGTFEAGMLNGGSFSGPNQILSKVMSFSLGYRF